MGLLTNLVALVKKTGSPLGKVFFHRRGTRRGSWRHGRGSAVRHQRHPPVSHEADQALARRANAFRQGSPRGPTAHPLAPDTQRFSVPCWLVYFIAARVFLCVMRWNLHCTPLPVTPDRCPTLANVHHASRVDNFVLVVRWGSNCTFVRVTPDR